MRRSTQWRPAAILRGPAPTRFRAGPCAQAGPNGFVAFFSFFAARFSCGVFAGFFFCSFLRSRPLLITPSECRRKAAAWRQHGMHRGGGTHRVRADGWTNEPGAGTVGARSLTVAGENGGNARAVNRFR